VRRVNSHHRKADRDEARSTQARRSHVLQQMGAARAAPLLVSYYSMPNMLERDRQVMDGPAPISDPRLCDGGLPRQAPWLPSPPGSTLPGSRSRGMAGHVPDDPSSPGSCGRKFKQASWGLHPRTTGKSRKPVENADEEDLTAREGAAPSEGKRHAFAAIGPGGGSSAASAGKQRIRATRTGSFRVGGRRCCTGCPLPCA
jgi:hypothetical protein